MNRAVTANDFLPFEKVGNAVTAECNTCDAGMGYGFIKVVKQDSPCEVGNDYKGSSKAEDVPT